MTSDNIDPDKCCCFDLVEEVMAMVSKNWDIGGAIYTLSYIGKSIWHFSCYFVSSSQKNNFKNFNGYKNVVSQVFFKGMLFLKLIIFLIRFDRIFSR